MLFNLSRGTTQTSVTKKNIKDYYLKKYNLYRLSSRQPFCLSFICNELPEFNNRRNNVYSTRCA